MFGLIGIVLGILSAALGVFLVFFFSGPKEEQPMEMSTAGIVIGIAALISAAVLIFVA